MSHDGPAETEEEPDRPQAGRSPKSPSPKVPISMKHPRALALAAVAVALAAPGSAFAGSAVGDAVGETSLGTVAKTLNTLAGRTDSSCIANTTTSKPFSPWRDPAEYVEAPGGSFESGVANAWDLAGGVSFANENEPWRVSGRASDSRSVVLGSGGSITSAPLCAGIAYPTLRFFARSPKGSALALVTARYTGPDGLLAALPLGVVTAGSSWAPTSVSLTASGLPLVTGANLSIRIAPVLGSLQVDDVYVDPIRRS